MRRILALQFGNVYQRRQRGFTLLSRLYAHPAYLWLDPVTEEAGRNIKSALLEGYVASVAPATLALGLPEGDYEIQITAFTANRGHGPYTVTAGSPARSLHVSLIPGQRFRARLPVSGRGNRLEVRFTPSPGRDFIVNAIEVFAAKPTEKLPPLFRLAPPAAPPSRSTLRRARAAAPLPALQRVCDWLLRHRRAGGYLGDSYGPGEDFWYTASMPLRTLLAGHRLLGRRDCLDAATTLLDDFVGEQLPNGAWEAVRRGRPTARLAPAEVQRIRREERLPLSDIGSMTTTLAVAVTQVGRARQARYLSALRRFADDWAPQFQRRTGAFDDGLWPQPTAVYSCATAIQASTYALLAKVSGENRYLAVAERAMRFLLKDWRPDGRMVGRAPHWVVHNRRPFVLESLHFGDQWYYDEGFITTWHHSTDPELRKALLQALNHRVHGRAGLLQARGQATWWPYQDVWNNAKSVGMVQTLAFVARHGRRTRALDQALAESMALLASPRHATGLGVMVSDRGRRIAQHGVRSWAGFRMESTGFAGMTLAELIQPGVLYLA